MDYIQLQKEYQEYEDIITEYIEENALNELTDEFQKEYNILRGQIIDAQALMNGVEYDFEGHRMNVESDKVINTYVVKLLFSYYNLLEALLLENESEILLHLGDVKAGIEDVLIDDFMSQQFVTNAYELA